MGLYTDFKKQNDKEFHDFVSENIHFAFGNQQFDELLKKLNMTVDEVKEQYVTIYGGLLHKDKVAEYKELSKRMRDNMRNKLFTDYDFAVDAFTYEFGNYECYISGRYDEALYSLDLVGGDLATCSMLNKAYKQARHEYNEWCEQNL